QSPAHSTPTRRPLRPPAPLAGILCAAEAGRNHVFSAAQTQAREQCLAARERASTDPTSAGGERHTERASNRSTARLCMGDRVRAGSRERTWRTHTAAQRQPAAFPEALYVGQA